MHVVWVTHRLPVGLLGNMYGWVCAAVGRFSPGAPLFALQAPPFPWCHIPLRPAPRLLQNPISLHFPLLLRGMTAWGSGGGGGGGGHRVGSRSAPPPSFFRSARGCGIGVEEPRLLGAGLPYFQFFIELTFG